MQKEDKSRLIRRLLMLIVLLGCLGLLTTSRSAASGPTMADCDSAYNECNFGWFAGCYYTYPEGSQALLDCTGACFRSYQACVMLIT